MTNQAATNIVPNHEKPHFVLVPIAAQGHMIPMADMACILATHGATVTFVTTPLNAGRLKPIIDRATESGLPLRFLSLHFPCSEVGLPDGCEFLDAVPSPALLPNFVQACAMLQEPLLRHLRTAKLPRPSCIIYDTGHPWIREVAQELGVPRLAFNGFGCFSLLCRHIIRTHRIFEEVNDENVPVTIPGLPQRIEISKTQSPGNFGGASLDKHREVVEEVASTADGAVVNTFDDLETWYIEGYKKAIGMKVWTVGPTFLCNGNDYDRAARGNKASIDAGKCWSWLESMKPGSAVYVSFGSLARTPPAQLVEIGLGLEASNCPFIWVIKAGDKSWEMEEWLSEGFEERIGGRGLIIRGWAPQTMILSHPAIGGFMTHCGWNSTLESVASGVPMITWPHFGEQFLNEKLIVEVLGIGIAVGVKALTRWGEVATTLSAKRDDVEKLVCRLMDEEEGKEMRERARGLQEKAKKAMEAGGSSHQNMKLLLQQIQTSICRKDEN